MFSCSVDCGFMCQLWQQSLPSLGSLKESVEKMDSDYFQILKTSQNTKKSSLSEVVKPGVGNKVLNEAVRRNPDERQWSCQSAHWATSLCCSWSVSLKGKIQPKTPHHCFKKAVFGDVLSKFWGPYFLYFHGYKLISHRWEKGFLCGFCRACLCLHTTLTTKLFCSPLSEASTPSVDAPVKLSLLARHICGYYNDNSCVFSFFLLLRRVLTNMFDAPMGCWSVNLTLAETMILHCVGASWEQPISQMNVVC